MNVDFEIQRQLSKANASLRNTLKACIDTVSKTYFNCMYANPELSDLAKSVINNLKSELKEIENEDRSNESPTNQGVLIQYP